MIHGNGLTIDGNTGYEPKWLPAVTVIGFTALVVVLTVLYVNRDSELDFTAIPTISFMAVIWPSSRIFAVGMGVISCALFFIGLFMSDVLAVNESRSAGTGLFWFTLFTSVMLTTTGGCNLGEIAMLHNAFAAIAFISLMVVCIIVLVVEWRKRIGSFLIFKCCLAAIGLLSTIAMVVSVLIGDSDLMLSLAAIFEFVVLGSVLVQILLFWEQLSKLTCVFTAELEPVNGHELAQSNNRELDDMQAPINVQ